MDLAVLFLLHQDKTDRDLFFDVVSGYRNAGHDVSILDMTPYWRSKESAQSEDAKQAADNLWGALVFQYAQQNQVQLCVSFGSRGVASLIPIEGKNFFEGISLAHLMHWERPPQWDDNDEVLRLQAFLTNGEFTYHHVACEPMAIEMQNMMDYRNIIPMPFAASPSRFFAMPDIQRAADISAILEAPAVEPTVLMLSELEKEEPDFPAIERDLAKQLFEEMKAVCEPFFEGNVEAFVHEMIEARIKLESFSILDLFRKISEQHSEFVMPLQGFLEDTSAYVKFGMLLRKLQSWRKPFTAAWLARFFKVQIAGDVTGWPDHWFRVHDEVAYPEKNAFFNGSKFALAMPDWRNDGDVGRDLFEIPMSGTCLLRGVIGDVPRYFGDDEAVVFQQLHYARGCIEGLLADMSRLENMMEKGQNAVLQKHKWSDRASSITDVIIRNQMG